MLIRVDYQARIGNALVNYFGDSTLNIGVSWNIPFAGPGGSVGFVVDTTGKVGFYGELAPAMNSVVANAFDKISGENKSDDLSHSGGGLDFIRFTVDAGVQKGDVKSQSGINADVYAGIGTLGGSMKLGEKNSVQGGEINFGPQFRAGVDATATWVIGVDLREFEFFYNGCRR
jgi:hypothetical protein